MAREDLHFRLRIPEELKKVIESAAEKNRRSMTAEIVGRLEAYDAIWANMAEMTVEQEKLSAQLEATRDALKEQRAVSAGLQQLLKESHDDAVSEEDTLGAIQKRFNELKAQTEYLESLKAELLELSKERDAISSDTDEILKEQSELIAQLQSTQKTTAQVLLIIRDAFVGVASGDNKSFERLVEEFKKHKGE